MESKIELGVVKIVYNKLGEPKTAMFEPSLKLDSDKKPDLLKQLGIIDTHNSKESVKANADLVMAAWWSMFNDIELADREQYVIDSEVVKCIKQHNLVKSCEIKYVFKKLVN